MSLVIDGQGHSTRVTAPYVFSLDTIQLNAGAHTLMARTTDRAGNLSEATISVNVQPQIQLQITSPANGSTGLYSPLLAQGLVVDNVSEVGITVNGYVAEVQNGQFAVDGVFLAEGANTFIATAADGSGVTATASVGVQFLPGASTVPPVQIIVTSPVPWRQQLRL